jgi:hypothetical protein
MKTYVTCMAPYGLVKTKGCHSSSKDDVWRKAEENKFVGTLRLHTAHVVTGVS